jgi:hypothetical protein
VDGDIPAIIPYITTGIIDRIAAPFFVHACHRKTLKKDKNREKKKNEIPATMPI